MKILLIVLFVTLLLSFTNKNDCKLLPDGNYRAKIIFNRSEADYTININNGNFIKVTKNGDSTKGKVLWHTGCLFQLDDAKKLEPDTSAFGKLIAKSFGEHLIELKSAEGDTINFRTTYSANLEVTGELGMFIRIR